MKLSRSQVRRRSRALPTISFEQQRLTSFSGLLLFQALFERLRLRARLRHCFAEVSGAYSRSLLFLGLVVHLLLGYRELRESRYYREDPMVLRLLQLAQLPDVSTVSRFLAEVSAESLGLLRRLLRELVVDRLRLLGLARLTLDFDGSVLSTTRHAEGTAVGFNRKKKGARSYYPLFCTIAQTGQVFDVHHRPGNVHDSHGAREFIVHCVEQIRAALPGVVVEARLDSAFFSDGIVSQLAALGVEFSLSVPFERFVELKQLIEARRRWQQVDSETQAFELHWKPKCWQRRYRLVVLKTRRAERAKGPLQLDLFVPVDFEHDFTVVVTNKQLSARRIVRFHHGRGAQEGVFAELKSQGHLDYIPARTLAANQTYMLAALLAYNLHRELQMVAHPPQRVTTEKRIALWPFQQLSTLRGTLLQRAGRFTRPQGNLTLTISANEAVQTELMHYLKRLQNAA
jgi:hypothetical protein